ncbi:MAG: enolase C-terminal domain-like protein [Acidimicrobiales bacterium]
MSVEPLPVRATLHRLRYPLAHAHVAAHGTEDHRELVLVEVELADGTVGWGECSALARPTYTAEHAAGAWLVLRDELVPAALAGREPGVVGHPMATAAVRTAVLDARLRAEGASLAAALAGEVEVAEAVPWCAVVSRGADLGDLVTAVAERLRGPVDLVKLKVTPATEDLAAVREVRFTWPDLPLAVDFNGTATDDALRALERVGLTYVEQPAPADQLLESARMAARAGCPVALDESVSSPGDLDAAVALGAGSVLNVKPARCGGPDRAAELLSRARAAGWGAFVGGMLESGVGRAAALAVAAQATTTLPTDLGPSLSYVDVDVTEALGLDGNGRMRIPTGPGIGVVPIDDHLRAVTVERVDLRS